MSVYNSSSASSANRLLPYAQELALSYLAHAESGLSRINGELERMNSRRRQLENALPGYEGEVGQHNDEGKERRLARCVQELHTARRTLEDMKEYISRRSAVRDQFQEHLSHRPRIQELIEELYSSAFEGVTHEFPHEDDVEASVLAAKQEQESCSRAVFASIDVFLTMLPSYVFMFQHALAQLHEFVRSHDNDNPPNTPDPVPSARSTLLEDYCQAFFEWYSTLTVELEAYRDKQPTYPLPAISWVEDPEEFLRTMRAAMLTPGKQQEASNILVNIANQLKEFWFSTMGAHRTDRERRAVALNRLGRAGKVLDLRLKHLAKARCEILDHIIDPTDCPLHGPTVQPPDHPHLHASTSSSTICTLLDDPKTVSRLNRPQLDRARCATSPPALVSERHTFPGYSGTEDVEVVLRHCLQIVSRKCEANKKAGCGIKPISESDSTIQGEADRAA
ncbi:hypothetical protein FRC10_002032 [Ceratobasidium sp. 414]|nr:hypothetical protein FRC10_002032 [Ceratobasidium sp. 414]